jgi:Carboxypeptidase regulatory-like domain
MRLAAAACLIAVLFTVALIGQNEDTGTRSVQGVVTDASGKPAAGAVVQLKDTKSLQIRSYITETDGSYHFAGLSTNVEYELEAKKDAVTSGKKTLTVFNTKKAAIVNLKLKK